MITIYKYKIDLFTTTIQMPADAKILTAAFQDKRFYLWAEVDTENPDVARYFKAFGTGHDIPYSRGVDFKYIATGVMPNGATGFMPNGLVFHAYEILGL